MPPLALTGPERLAQRADCCAQHTGEPERTNASRPLARLLLAAPPAPFKTDEETNAERDDKASKLVGEVHDGPAVPFRNATS